MFPRTAPTVQGDCYPTNNTHISGGATEAEGNVSGKFEELELEVPSEASGNPVVVKNLGGGTLTTRFNAEITTAGKIQGWLTAKIHWTDSKLGETEFESGCIAEVQTAVQSAKLGGELEAEYEGTVENFPGFKGTSKAAVVSIVAHEDPDNPGKIEFDFVIELGYTSHENYAFSGSDEETGKIALKAVSLKNFEISNVNAGRCSGPPGFSCALVETD